MAQGEGIVRINPALFAKLASPPDPTLPAGIMQAGKAVGEGLAEGFRLKLARREKAIEREHETGISAAQIASRKALQETALEAKESLTRWVEGLRHESRERSATIAEDKLTEVKRHNAATELQGVKRLAQYEKQIEFARDSQDALNLYRTFEAEHKKSVLEMEDRHRKVLAELAEKRITLSREQLDLMNRRFVADEMKAAQDAVKSIQSAAQRAAGKIGSSGGSIEEIREDLEKLMEGNRSVIESILGDKVPQQTKDAFIRSIQANIVGTGAKQQKPVFSLFGDIAAAGGERPQDVEALGAAIRGAFSRGTLIPEEEGPGGMSPEAMKAMEFLGNIPTYDLLADQAAAAATQPAPR